MGKLYLHNKITEVISKYDNIKWVEIGVRFGRNSKYVLNNYDISEIYLIDPYCELPYLTNIFNKKSVQEHKKTAKADLKPFEDKCVWLEDFSQNVVDQFENESIDIIYIDGDHSYDAVIRDLELYYPKIKKGGLVIGDDYNEKDVKLAIEAFAKKMDIEYQTSEVKNGSGKFWFVK